MKIDLAIVPPGGGETDYVINYETEVLPRSGEYIYLVEVAGASGIRAFLVRNVFHQGNLIKEGHAKSGTAVVEVEFVEHPIQSSGHQKSVDMYNARGKRVKEAPNTAY